MVSKKRLRFFGFFTLIIGILILGFVLAALDAPDDLIFEDNTTTNYDKEGVFTVNWTEVTNAESYTIFIYTDGVLSSTNEANSSASGYKFSNSAEANYTFTIQAENSTGSAEYTNSTNISIQVDTTAPVITLPEYTNATSKKASDTLTLNISVADALSGETGTVCLIDVNGTSNQTIDIDSGWCNSSTISLTDCTIDGNHTLKIYVNDTVNNIGLNNSFVVQVDSTAPTASASCSPSTLYVEEVVTCSCSGTDATSGVNSSLTTASSTPSTSIAGTFTYSCSVTDNTGNSASATAASYNIISRGGGDSSPNEWANQESHSWSKMTPGSATIIKDFDKEIGLKQIQIEVKNEAQNVKITVRKYDAKPAEVTKEKAGKVHKYLQIEITNLEDKLSKAILTIQVEKAWVSDNGLDKEDIVLSKFDETGTQWNELTTTYKEEDDSYYYYDSELTSFSYFAIGAKAALVEAGDEGTGATTTDEEEKNLTWLWILIGVIVLGVIIKFSLSNKTKIKNFFKGKH